jgi:hypothetical protein
MTAEPETRILFYLPVVTPWWFDSIIAPLVRLLVKVAQVHIIAPVPWCGTGIGSEELTSLTDLLQLHWHILDGKNHPTMRTDATDRAAIVEFVNSLAPAYVLCRSADCETVRGFAGEVRFLMEGGASPLAIPSDWVVMQDQPFDHGCMPELTDEDLDRLDRLMAPTWKHLLRFNQSSTCDREAFRKWAGLPADRPILALPLEYEHEENFFPIHRIGATPNRCLIAELDVRIDDSFFLAITNHPLNALHVDNRDLEAAIASRGSRMRLLPDQAPKSANTTMLLAQNAQGMIVGDSKVYSIAAFCGTPMLRQSRFKTGSWMNAYTDLETFLPAVAGGGAVGATQEDARRWFAFHVGNNIFDPKDTGLTPDGLLARIDRPVDPKRWENAFARYHALAPEIVQ